MKYPSAFIGMIQLMQKFHTLSPFFISRLQDLVTYPVYRKGDIVQHYRETQSTLLFIHSGVMSEKTVKENPRGINTTWFWDDGDAVFTSPGIFSGKPSEAIIEALETCECIGLSAYNLAILKHEFRETEQIIECLRDQHIRKRLQHTMDMRLGTFRQTKRLYEARPRLFEVSAKSLLADFLNMDPDTFARNLKRLKG
ncbi:Crp/Fnr family transcriptional regulator [Pedobacter faecalis]|uniref:Crp/Fnr family transcriptional regulator n=1 Tax=Pedobacter faecalis TaxID=3041495 RepID=UPI0025514331|nr:hypothetical protein [Pedobacter sp. ELA7]